MIKEKIERLNKNYKESTNKRKIENLIFLVIILIITLIFINSIIKDDDKIDKNQEKNSGTLQEKEIETNMNNLNVSNSLEKGLEEILSTIKGAGQVKVFINYSESSKTIAMYDETTTTSTTEESDSSGGKRNVTETESKKDVIYSEKDGNKTPITEKTVMPTIVGAIVTAEGAGNASVKVNIVNAVSSVTGLTIDKVQVYEMK